MTRRRLLAGGLGAAVVVVIGGGELVDHGVLPGRHELDVLTGACSAPSPQLTFTSPGPTHSGSFYSQYRHRRVGYTIAYPPGHGPGDDLALVLSLYGDGGNHTTGIAGLTLAQVLAARQDDRALAPFALASVDGGSLYWNPHPGDDPLGMLIHEFVPMCQRRGLGVRDGSVGAVGVSMGGYGALLLAERAPSLIAAVAAISPAVWTSYDQARAVNAGAFASAADFAADDIITHAGTLAGRPVRVASGTDDPFHPGVLALVRALPAGAIVELRGGCHDQTFFASQQHASMSFLAEHLVPA